MIPWLNIVGIIIGGAAIIALLMFSINELKKFGVFLKIRHEPGKPKHDRRTMTISFIKYLIVLFFVVLASGVFYLILIVVLPFAIYIIFNYIKLWKYHERSVLFFIGMTCAAIIAGAAISPFVKMGVEMLLLELGIVF